MALAEDGGMTREPGRGTGFWPSVWKAPAGAWAVAGLMLLMPLILPNTLTVISTALVFGIIALSLMVLGGLGGMVSVAQMTIAGVAGYMVAIFGLSSVDEISLGLSWYVAVPLAIAIASGFAALVGLLAVRTEGIFTIIITLAIAAAMNALTNANYTLFNGFSGFLQVHPPHVFGVEWKDTVPFYYLCLGAALLCYGFVLYLRRAPFGMALEGVRDNPRRMAALGYNVNGHRVAAYAVAGAIAGIGGILATWDTGQITPEAIGVGDAINILIMAVVGGMSRPIGPFIGALIFVMLRNFSENFLTAIELDPRRFQLVIGIGFLVIVLVSRDGVLGIWDQIRERVGRDRLTGERRER